MLYGFSCGNFCYDDRRIFIGAYGFRFFDGYSPIWLMIMYLVGAYMKNSI